MVEAIHLGHKPDPSVLESLADFICGDDEDRYPEYRSSQYLTQFFQSVQIDAQHDGSTRRKWVLWVLNQLPPAEVERVILRLVDLRTYKGDRSKLSLAVSSMNDILAMDELAISYDGGKPHLTRGEAITLSVESLAKMDTSPDEGEFLKRQFPDDISIEELGLDPVITPYLQARVDEAQSCSRDTTPLATVFLLGSTLEGMLLGAALLDQKPFMTASKAPKDKNGVVKKIYDWKLVELIDVSQQVGLLNLDVVKFSHVLRDFRNYIHPYRQMSQGFTPDQHTVDICWQVFKAAFTQIRAALAAR